MEAVKTTTILTNTPAETEVKGKAEKKSGKRIGYNYIILKSLKESQKNDVVKCLYIKSLTNFGFCVVKEGSYGDTKDKQGRDIKDRLVWQKQLHEALQDKVRMPKLMGSFEERGNYYLVMEHIKGKPLYKACYEKKNELREALITGSKLGFLFLDYLVQIVTILETLHQHHVVHRDATANNFIIIPGGKVAVIDMELSYSLQQQYPSPPFQLGTYGYMSPQQETTQTPTVAEDIFSIGAIILQVWTSISPSKLTNEPAHILSKKVRFLIPDQQVGDMVIQCLDPEPGARPSAATIRKTLLQYKIDLQKKLKRPLSQPLLFTKEDMLATVQQVIHTFASPLFADAEKGWFADNMKPQPNADKNKLVKMWYASYNRGVSGIMYMLSHAKKTGMEIEATMPFVQKAMDLIKERYIDRIEATSPGLHFGSDGIAAALSVAVRNDLIEPTHEHLEWIDQLLGKEKEILGVKSGITGLGIANMVSKQFISSQKMKERLQRYVQQLLLKQEKDGSWVYEKKKKKRKKIIYTFADGMAGIIYFLLEYGQRYQHFESMEAARRGLRWLMKKAIRNQESIQWMSGKNKPLSFGFADGLAGIVLPFIKAYYITNDPVYKQYATGILYSINPAIIDNNLGQFNGLSGLGEVYLEAYRVFNDRQWLERGAWVAQVIMQLKKQHPIHGPYWLVEHERQPVANFMIGNSGVLHFLLRYCYPEKIGFPLMPETE